MLVEAVAVIKTKVAQYPLEVPEAVEMAQQVL
jgi:hypothetical protein